ncbi:DUF484 family protein, partial [Bacillus subtilis]|uniref:DUF484 family protein n=1 Tax=Bacillus subtilis TaxID=1423 RepID=UPI0018E2150A
HELFDRLLSLESHLAAADSLQDMLNRLHRWARELGLAGANVRLFSDKWLLGAPSSPISDMATDPIALACGNSSSSSGPLMLPR